MNEKETKIALAKLTEEYAQNQEIVKLIAQYNEKKITISSIAENLKVSAGFVKTYLTAGIPFLAYNPEVLNVFGLQKILEKIKLAPADFSMIDWKFNEASLPRIPIDWKLGLRCMFSNSHGQQNANCIYETVWMNDGFVLVLPVVDFKIDEIGKKLDTPRILSRLVASNMKPRFADENGNYPAIEVTEVIPE